MNYQDIFSTIQTALETAKKSAKDHKLMEARCVAEAMLDEFFHTMEENAYTYCSACELWFDHQDRNCPDHKGEYCKKCRKDMRAAAQDDRINLAYVNGKR